ncbi:MAG: hypothetical protein U5J63_06020 [Fodinibius sp.]|nr:hypothetical protein [Fodinibius sp.]
MTENDSPDSSKVTNKKLVRILVIVGIGIPVLVELLTLFNLVNVQLFSKEEKVHQQEAQPVKVVQVQEGDTLLTDTEFPVVISQMQVRVSARQWQFHLELVQPDTSAIRCCK